MHLLRTARRGIEVKGVLATTAHSVSAFQGYLRCHFARPVQISDASSKGQHLFNAPFCNEHANYWSGTRYLTLARLGVAAIFFFGLIIAAIFALTVGPGVALVWAALCVLAMFAVAGLIIYVQRGRIEQMQPDMDFLILSNVSNSFRTAMGHAVRAYPEDTLASMQRKQGRMQVIQIMVLPVMAALAFLFVGGTLWLIAPPSGLPAPAGGPQTSGNDQHCYELLMRKDVKDEARSYLRWHSGEAVEGWDHATTVKAVNKLYDLGAQKVFYHPVLLLVVLPKDTGARKRIFQWVFEDVKKQKGEITPDEKQWYLMVSPN